jgi:translation initiation factor IF-1
MSLLKGGKKIKRMKATRDKPANKNINLENALIGEVIKILGGNRLSVKLENGKEAQAFFGNKFAKKGSQYTRFKSGDYLQLEENNGNESGTIKLYEVLCVVQNHNKEDAKEKIESAFNEDNNNNINEEEEDDIIDNMNELDKNQLKIERSKKKKEVYMERKGGRQFTDPETLKQEIANTPFNFDDI